MPQHPQNIKSKYLGPVAPPAVEQPAYLLTKRLNKLYRAYLLNEISDRDFSNKVDKLIGRKP